ncbi:MAG: shikimate dehydrogenase [Bacteroidia bacterium]|nr:shikimate dehydrogenase [Bacteroidia bacterium]
MQQFGLIGFPLSHSFSKKYFTEKFEKEKLSGYSYELYPLASIDQYPALVEKTQDLIGLNVTIPYKESIIPFLDALDPLAEKIGAVNCIKFENGKSKGYNTDAFGFKQSIKPFIETQHERALILGTGGASKAVFHVLNEIGIDCYFVSRDKSQLDTNKAFNYDELNEYVMNAFKLIVNTSPVGTYPSTQEFPAIPYEYIGKGYLLYDLIYNPEETQFLKKGRAQGAVGINGLSMLQQQAEEAWRIWTQK